MNQSPIFPPSALLILNYNGASLLPRMLPPLIAEIKATPGNHRVIVIDNASNDGSKDLVESEYPDVEWIGMEDNAWLLAYNRVLPDLEEKFVVLLNNDMIVNPGFLPSLLKKLRAGKNVFGIVPAIDSDNQSECFGERRLPFFRWGVLTSRPDTSRPSGYTIWLHGGAAALDREKFIALGGFDPLFAPGYGEDNDLAYRAWKRGWEILFEPVSRAFHIGHATVSRYLDDKKRLALKERCMSLFILKNIQDPAMRRQFWLWFGLRLGKSLLTANATRFKALLSVPSTFAGANGVFTTRQKIGALTDREIFEKIILGGEVIK